MMKRNSLLIYFTYSDLMVPRVDRQCIMKFCEALARCGFRIELVSYNVKLMAIEPKYENIWKVYGIRNRFPIKIFPTGLKQTSSPKIAGIYKLILYPLYLYYKTKKEKVCIVLFRNYSLIIPFLIIKKLCHNKIYLILECDMPPAHRYRSYLMRKLDGLFATCQTLARDLTTHCNYSKSRILAVYQGVDLEYVDAIRISKKEARKKLNLPLDKKIVVYTGKVYKGYKEIELLIATAKLLPKDILMLIVGGRPDHVEYYELRGEQEKFENIKFISFVPPTFAYYYQFAADVLISYYPKGMVINNYRAPGKLFSYMASKRPIIAADYPFLREILKDGESALFVEPNNPELLAAKITNILSDKKLSANLALAAYKVVSNYTWQKRAEKVINFIYKITDNEFCRYAK